MPSPCQNCYEASYCQPRKHDPMERKRVSLAGIGKSAQPNRPKQHFDIKPESGRPGQQHRTPSQVLGLCSEVSQDLEAQEQIHRGRAQKWKDLADGAQQTISKPSAEAARF